jgi:hypothetical protein
VWGDVGVDVPLWFDSCACLTSLVDRFVSLVPVLPQFSLRFRGFNALLYQFCVFCLLAFVHLFTLMVVAAQVVHVHNKIPQKFVLDKLLFVSETWWTVSACSLKTVDLPGLAPGLVRKSVRSQEPQITPITASIAALLSRTVFNKMQHKAGFPYSIL